MSSDLEGYGASDGAGPLERLLADLRVMGASSVERAAHGWDQMMGEQGLEDLEAAQRKAVASLERAGRGAEWEGARQALESLTEGGAALVSWKIEHGPVGEKAERAAKAAILALLVDGNFPDSERSTLLGPLAAALPWLLSQPRGLSES